MGTIGAIGSGCSTSSSTSGIDGGPTGGNNDSGATGATGDGGGTGSTGDGGGTGPIGDGGEGGTPQVTPANLILAHASPGLPPFRVCFASTSGSSVATVTAIHALPDTVSGVPYGFYGSALPDGGINGGGPFPQVAPGTPGLYPGTIGAFPSLGLSYQGLAITPYAILASSIANDMSDGGLLGTNGDGGAEEDCVHLIGTHGLGTGDTATGSVAGRLTLNQDFFALTTIPVGTLKDGQTFLLTINGCLPGGAYDPQAQSLGLTCGAGDAGPWVGINQVDTTTPGPDAGIGIQFANRAVALQGTPTPFCADPPTCSIIVNGQSPATNGVTPGFIIPTEEDGGPEAGEVPGPTEFVSAAGSLTAPITYNGQGLSAVTAVPLNPAVASLFGVITATADGGAPTITAPPYSAATEYPVSNTIPIPISSIEEASGWTSTTATSSSPAGTFVLGQTYTFILMGDPAAQQATSADGGLNPAYDGRGLHMVAFPNVFKPQLAAGAQ